MPQKFYGKMKTKIVDKKELKEAPKNFSVLNLKDLDVLHCKRENFLGKAIRLLTKGRFNHTALFIMMENQPFIIDSQADGTHLRPFSVWQKKYGYKFDVSRLTPEVDPKRREMFKKQALRQIGHKKYDLASLLWFYPRYIFTGKWKGKKKAPANEKFYCSEFIAFVFNHPEYWKQSPQDVYNWLNKHEFFETINFIYE